MNYQPPKLAPHEGSWAIVDNATGKLATELFRDSKAIKYLRTDKYHAVPMGIYLGNLVETISVDHEEALALFKSCLGNVDADAQATIDADNDLTPYGDEHEDWRGV